MESPAAGDSPSITGRLPRSPLGQEPITVSSPQDLLGLPVCRFPWTILEIRTLAASLPEPDGNLLFGTPFLQQLLYAPRHSGAWTCLTATWDSSRQANQVASGSPPDWNPDLRYRHADLPRQSEHRHGCCPPDPAPRKSLYAQRPRLQVSRHVRGPLQWVFLLIIRTSSFLGFSARNQTHCQQGQMLWPRRGQ